MAGAPFFQRSGCANSNSKKSLSRSSIGNSLVIATPRAATPRAAMPGAGPPLSVKGHPSPAAAKSKRLCGHPGAFGLSCFSLKRAEMAAGVERYWKIFPPLPAMISQFHPILANLVSTMQTKVFRVSCVAGIPLDRAPQTPIKKVTVYLPAAVLLTDLVQSLNLGPIWQSSDSLSPRAPGSARRPFLKFAPEPSRDIPRAHDRQFAWFDYLCIFH